MQAIRVAIIGCGTIAPAHIESYQRLDGVELACLCDREKGRAETLASRYDVPTVTDDYRELMSDPTLDALSICTDHASHATLTTEALAAGKHVLCEKPLAHTLAGMDAICATHKAHPECVCGVVFQHRFDASIRCLKKAVDDGLFGSIITCGAHVRCRRGPAYYEGSPWRGTWAMEGGSVTINQAIHTIDSLLWLIGPVVQVTGAYANNELRDVIETEDTAVAVFRFKNGVLGTLETTASSNLGWENTLFIHGTEGAVELRDGKAQKVAFADNAITTQVREALMGCYDPALIQAGKRYYGKTHPAQIEDFILAIREKRKPFILPQSARHTVEVVLALYQSQRQSEWISLPLQQEGVASR